MSVNLAALKTEVTTDPLSWGYGALLESSPGVIVDMLNDSTKRTAVQAIPANLAMIWAAGGPYAHIVDNANNPASPVRASCMVVQTALVADKMIDLQNPTIRAMFDAWEAAGVISSIDHSNLLAMATQPANRVLEMGIVDGVADTGVTEADLRAALAS